MKKQRWRWTKGKKHWNCDFCGKFILVPREYQPEYCCSGWDCGCYGMPINEMLCDKCLEMHFGQPVKEDCEDGRKRMVETIFDSSIE